MNCTVPISNSLLPPDKVRSLNRFVLRNVSLLQTHVVAQHLGKPREHALAILQLIASSLGIEKVYLIYHDSCPVSSDAFVEERPVRVGLPFFPYECPLCGQIITNPDNISFDFAVRIPTGIQISVESLSA